MGRSKWFIMWTILCSQNIRFKTSMLTSDLCDYSKAYIVVKGTIIVTGTNNDNRRKKGRF